MRSLCICAVFALIAWKRGGEVGASGKRSGSRSLKVVRKLSGSVPGGSVCMRKALVAKGDGTV